MRPYKLWAFCTKCHQSAFIAANSCWARVCVMIIWLLRSLPTTLSSAVDFVQQGTAFTSCKSVYHYPICCILLVLELIVANTACPCNRRQLLFCVVVTPAATGVRSFVGLLLQHFGLRPHLTKAGCLQSCQIQRCTHPYPSHSSKLWSRPHQSHLHRHQR